MVIISVTLARGQCWGHGHFKYPITLRFSTYLNQLYPYVLKECCIRFTHICFIFIILIHPPEYKWCIMNIKQQQPCIIFMENRFSTNNISCQLHGFANLNLHLNSSLV